MTVSDKIDRIVTNRILALPIFALVMWLVYYIAMSTIGAAATDWTNDNLFGDGFHLFGIGSGAYEEVAEEYGGAAEVVDGFLSYAEEQGMDVDAISEALDAEAEDYDTAAAAAALDEQVGMFDASSEAAYLVEDEETLATEETTASYDDLVEAAAV